MIKKRIVCCVFCIFVKEINAMYLTIRINNKTIYDDLILYLRSQKIQIVSQQPDDEEAVWHHFFAEGLNKAYSKDEPDYELSMIKEPNPEYEGR
jgi:hypothetical protein